MREAGDRHRGNAAVKVTGWHVSDLCTLDCYTLFPHGGRQIKRDKRRVILDTGK